MNLYGTVHVDAADLDPIVHCEHDNDKITVRLDRDLGGVSVVLTGTTAEIGMFADRLVHVVVERKAFEAGRSPYRLAVS